MIRTNFNDYLSVSSAKDTFMERFLEESDTLVLEDRGGINIVEDGLHELYKRNFSNNPGDITIISGLESFQNIIDSDYIAPGNKISSSVCQVRGCEVYQSSRIPENETLFIHSDAVSPYRGAIVRPQGILTVREEEQKSFIEEGQFLLDGN